MDFLNDLGKKFTHVARTVQERTREGVESTRLAADLRGARGELDHCYADLGRAYYESLSGEGAPVPEALIARVREASEQLAALTAQRERARAQARCPGCGAVQAEGARFCSSCGRRLPEDMPAPAAADEDLEYCPVCGAMRHGHARFCALCGHAFEPGSDPVALPVRATPPVEPLEEPEDAAQYEE